MEVGPQGHFYIMSQSTTSAQVDIYKGMARWPMASFTLEAGTSLQHIVRMDSHLSGTQVQAVGEVIWGRVL